MNESTPPIGAETDVAAPLSDREALALAFNWIACQPEGREPSEATCAYVPPDVYEQIKTTIESWGGDPTEVRPSDSLAESQAGLNGPSGSPTSPPQAIKPPREGMVRTEHGWAKPCSLCGSTNFGTPCPETKDGFHA